MSPWVILSFEKYRSFVFFKFYNGYNVVVDKPIVLNSSCIVGDRLCIVRERAWIRKIGLWFFM